MLKIQHLTNYLKKDNSLELPGNFEIGTAVIDKNNKGDTPLHIATSKGNKELVQLLLSKQAKIDIKN